ncbi:hypothetical protein ACXPWS_12845 [Mycobacterium sp. BMJ-28]
MKLRKMPSLPTPKLAPPRPTRPGILKPPTMPTPNRPRGAAMTTNQDEQRARRRKRLPVIYGGEFDLAADIAAATGVLAHQVSQLKRPAAARQWVDALADGIAEVVHVAAGLIAESMAEDDDTRRRAADLTVRPRQPVITEDMLVSGSWSAALVTYAQTVSEEVAQVLGRALPPDACRAPLSASQRIERALWEVDSAALALTRRIPRIRERQALPSISEFNASELERRENERAARRLAQIGAPR